MAEVYVMSEQDVRLFKQLIERERKTVRNRVTELRDRSVQSPPSYVARVPAGGLPAMTGESPPIPGVALCKIYEPVNNPCTDEVELYEVDGYEEYVYNILREEVPESYIFVSREAFGRFIYDGDYGSVTSSTTTSTTTTPGACLGRCKMVWNAAGEVWNVAIDGCGVVTTTTTTSTSTTTTTTSTVFDPTSTTTTPCVWPTSTSTSSTTTSTSTTSTTTTTAGCECMYPTFCGTVDGECTYTSCARDYSPTTPYCSTTTSTSTTTTTTTTASCDCNTTTTAGPNQTCASSGCTYHSVLRNGVWVWDYSNVSDGCSRFGQYCICGTPPPAGCCAQASVPCVELPIPPTTQPPPPYCTGQCVFVWDCWATDWYLDEGHEDYRPCLGFGMGCHCPAPTYTPSQGCPVEKIACGGSTPSTSTTSSTTTTPGACWQCYTTTSWSTSTSTTSTTTTTNPCDAECKYEWDSSSVLWSRLTNPCPSHCPCGYPATNGVEDCERAVTPCGGNTTSTTTTTSTTSTTSTTTSSTSTSSTTTTTTCLGACEWVCGGYGGWDLYDSDCHGGAAYCACHVPAGPCGSYGDTTSTACTDVTTTTTSSSTTSSTTTSAKCCEIFWNGIPPSAICYSVTDQSACGYSQLCQGSCDYSIVANCADCTTTTSTTSSTSSSSTSSSSTTCCSASEGPIYVCTEFSGPSYAWQLSGGSCPGGCQTNQTTAYCGPCNEGTLGNSCTLNCCGTV